MALIDSAVLHTVITLGCPYVWVGPVTREFTGEVEEFKQVCLVLTAADSALDRNQRGGGPESGVKRDRLQGNNAACVLDYNTCYNVLIISYIIHYVCILSNVSQNQL